MHWDIILLEMTPRPRSVVLRPFFIEAEVESSMIGDPAVVSSYHALGSFRPIASLVVKVPWEKLGGFV